MYSFSLQGLDADDGLIAHAHHQQPFSLLTHEKCLVPMAVLDYLAFDELDPVVSCRIPPRPCGGSVNGEAPAVAVACSSHTGRTSWWFARLMKKYTRTAKSNL